MYEEKQNALKQEIVSNNYKKYEIKTLLKNIVIFENFFIHLNI